MPRAFSEQEREFITQRLLEQGEKLFAAQGLKKTSIEELTEAVGISKGAFYAFYPSKEALFMDVAELAETLFRKEVLAEIDAPGPSPRARLFAVLKRAYSLWKTIPILQLFNRTDFDLLVRRVPAEQLQEHLASDQLFMEELITRCRNQGIHIRARAEDVSRFMYVPLLIMLHEDDLGPNALSGVTDALIEMIVAFWLGELELQVANPPSSIDLLRTEDDDESGNPN